MKTQTDYDIYRDGVHFISETAKDSIESLKESNQNGLTDNLSTDKLFFLASKGAKGKKIVWDLVKKNKVSVLRAHGKPNFYLQLRESVENKINARIKKRENI